MATAYDRSQPADDAFDLTPSDTLDLKTASGLPITARAIYVGTFGDVRLTTAGGSVSNFKNVAAGTILPVRTKRVWSTGTTASNIVGLF